MNKTELKEIKKGNIGTGLLIENDGYISMNATEHNKKICEGIEDGNWSVPYPFIVDAVFQKFDVKNANGRIYPESILKSQVQEYQTKIQEHRAYGECYKPDALILTEKGWKTLEEVKEGENILTLNVETNEIEIQPILEKIEKDFDGELINIKGRNINDEVTPDHQYILYDDNGKYYGRVSANDIYEKKENYSKKYIPTQEDNNAIEISDLNTCKVPYKGKVMCVIVKNHNFYVMCNGKTHWTSNYCNHPSESTIDLGRISHNIVELHWEGKTLVGKMELNISEGFRRNGICSSFGDTVALLLLNGYKIGVSSRGVGSVEQKLGNYVVGDDFELICWDIVSDPSTPGAYIGDRQDLTQYVENNEANKNKSTIYEKINKIENILKS